MSREIVLPNPHDARPGDVVEFATGRATVRAVELSPSPVTANRAIITQIWLSHVTKPGFSRVMTGRSFERRVQRIVRRAGESS